MHVLGTGDSAEKSSHRQVDISGSASGRDITSQTDQSSSHLTAILTRREADVLKLLAAGRTTLDIADALSVSINTVRNHTQNILRKLIAHTRLQAILQARDQQLI